MDDFLLSPNFSFFEVTNSEDHPELVDQNRQGAQAYLESLRWHYLHIMEPIRAARGLPIVVSSGYRNPVLNAAIGGSKTSQHMLFAPLAGQPALHSAATDWWFAGRSDQASRNEDVAWLAKNMKTIGIPGFHQLLLEGACIHIAGPTGVNDGRIQWAEPDPASPSGWATKTLQL